MTATETELRTTNTLVLLQDAKELRQLVRLLTSAVTRAGERDMVESLSKAVEEATQRLAATIRWRYGR